MAVGLAPPQVIHTIVAVQIGVLSAKGCLQGYIQVVEAVGADATLKSVGALLVPCKQALEVAEVETGWFRGRVKILYVEKLSVQCKLSSAIGFLSANNIKL